MVEPTVIIVSYNVRDLLGRCLESIEAGTEVIVVDNASPDDSANFVEAEFPAVTLIRSRENRGFATAVNQAARIANGNLYLLLNPDAELRPGTQRQIARRAADRPDVAIFGFRQVDAAGHFQLAVGPPPWLWAELLRKVVQRRLDAGDQRVGRALDRLLSRPCPVPWVAGSALLVRREAFERVGGFDEEYFMYFEDIDFCLRVRRTGGKVLYDPTVTILHHRGQSARKSSRLAEQAYRKGQLKFWSEHRGVWVGRLVHAYLALTGRLPDRGVGPG